MIEYLYDCIKATANTDTIISAEITDEAEAPITEGCALMLHDKEDNMIGTYAGIYVEELNLWFFTIPADDTKELRGRHMYCICNVADNRNLCFKQPIYFV